eukprot:605952-Amorphochlora_amoeboformis.AAC.2
MDHDSFNFFQSFPFEREFLHSPCASECSGVPTFGEPRTHDIWNMMESFFSSSYDVGTPTGPCIRKFDLGDADLNLHAPTKKKAERNEQSESFSSLLPTTNKGKHRSWPPPLPTIDDDQQQSCPQALPIIDDNEHRSPKIEPRATPYGSEYKLETSPSFTSFVLAPQSGPLPQIGFPNTQKCSKTSRKKQPKKKRNFACNHCSAKKSRCSPGPRPCSRCCERGEYYMYTCCDRFSNVKKASVEAGRKQKKPESSGKRKRLADDLNVHRGQQCDRDPKCRRPNFHPGHCKVGKRQSIQEIRAKRRKREIASG